jgi:mannose-6-phosphate isomerase-like protein (cupin superfamily)
MAFGTSFNVFLALGCPRIDVRIVGRANAVKAPSRSVRFASTRWAGRIVQLHKWLHTGFISWKGGTMGPLTRRNVLTSGAATLAGAALIGRPARAGADSSVDDIPFVVRAAEGHAGSPWVIRGATPIMAKVAGSDVQGRYSVIEVNTPPGRGPELHLHRSQNEIFFVLRGRIGLVCGTERMVLQTGDTFMAPKNVPHAYVALGTEVAGILNIFDPAGTMEDFFAAYTRILNTGGRPDPQQMEAAYAAHGMKVLGKPLDASSFS